ncbi:YdeI/OmpD-associated family protein [Bacillus horti]|uniref:YdeI/OmpD-associated family protein n=1 Tax=Caldalkalibacillus horti TaxID=77523 RepID=A0ABT9VU15_9BACI|nr:YdeI/OmpD-associated family protein [Bacillus horti]MDQ0164483.1 hypothetical protein [Bacillus horti]
MNSEKSIVDKLNLTKFPTKLVLKKPDDVHDLDQLSYDTTISKEKYDMVFTFIFSLDEYADCVQSVINQDLLTDKGYLFMAYPKKNNKKYSEYIDRDSFFERLPIDEEGFVLDSHIKFARMVSLNDVFTVIGLKSERKKTKKKSSSEKSQRVDDYIHHIEDIKLYLDHKKELLEIYNALTPGYQKDWARYVYSAKRKETQEKRLIEMEKILGEGYKSMDLYRRRK